MSKPSIFIPVALSFALACGPSSSSPSESETSSSDGGTSSSTLGGDASSGEPSSSGPDGEATGASSSSTAGSEAGDGSSGSAPSMFGRYVLTGSAAVLEPVGCAAERGEAAPWAIALGEPADDGSFAMQESYGELGNAFACMQTEVGFDCDVAIEVDYAAMGGPDANVRLTAHYGVAWAEGGTIAGTYDVGFACEGAACGDVVEQWNVLGFPCDIAVDFTGVLE